MQSLSDWFPFSTRFHSPHIQNRTNHPWRQKDWSTVAITVLEDVASDKKISFEYFNAAIRHLYVCMNHALQVAYPGIQLQPSEIDTHYEKMSELRKKSPIKAVDDLARSTLFSSLIPTLPIKSAEDIEFFKEIAKDGRLKESPQLQQCNAVVYWLAAVTLSILPPDRLKAAKSSFIGFPKEIQEKIIEVRQQAGEQMFKSFFARDVDILIRLLNNESVIAPPRITTVCKMYLNLFDELKDAGYDPASVRASLLVTLPILKHKLSDGEDINKKLCVASSLIAIVAIGILFFKI